MDAKIKFEFDAFLASIGNFLELVLCVVIICVFSTALHFSLNSAQYDYLLGDVAIKNVKSPIDFSIEDLDATKNFRIKALSEVPAVYDLDPYVQNRIASRVREVFKHYRNLQNGIKSKELREQLKGTSSEVDLHPLLFFRENRIRNRKIFSEKLGIDIGEGAYGVLVEHGFAESVPQFVNSIIRQIFLKGVISDEEKNLRDPTRGMVVRNLKDGSEKRVWAKNSFYGLTQARSMVRVIGDPILRKLDYPLSNLVVDFSQKLIEPNFIYNSEETNRRKEVVLKSITPKFQLIKSGEMILREGEVITQLHLTKLRVLNCELGSNWSSNFGLVVILLIALIIYYVIHLSPKIKSKKIINRDLIFLTTVLVVNMIIVKIWSAFNDIQYFGLSLFEIGSQNVKFGIPLAAGSMIVCLVLGRRVAFTFSFLSSIACSMLLPCKFEQCIYLSLSCVLAVWWIKDCRERSTIIKAGTKLGLFCAVMAIMIDCSLFKCSWYLLTFDVMVAFLSGIGVGIVVVGVLPVIEIVFRYTTDISLLELANLDKPVLRKLMLEAPGTYHHSVVVGTMVEAAASEIGVNPLLGRVCGYYHDIGKLKQPLYFVENQLHRRNKHDKLSPSMSSLVLISHVKHGMEIARKHNLDSTIIDVIEQHHGSSLISYFFEKAKQTKGEENINVSNFRYPGPIPQTVLAGLVMLADVVEAASRTLVNPTSSRIQGLVQNLINKVFSDGQLNNCNLTLKDLNSIAKSFNKILTGIYHHRVEYQSHSHNTTIDWRLRDASAGKKYSESTSDINTKNSSNSANPLRRLGLS